MKFFGKNGVKALALSLALASITPTLTACNSISGISHTYNKKEISAEELSQYKEDLKEKIQSAIDGKMFNEQLELGKKDNPYINGIKIDGPTLEITFVDGSTYSCYSGNQTLESSHTNTIDIESGINIVLSELQLQNLEIVDSGFLNDFSEKTTTTSNSDEITQKIVNNPDRNSVTLSIDDCTVYDTYRLLEDNLDAIDIEHNNTNLSYCKNIFLGMPSAQNSNYYNDLESYIKKLKNVETLFLLSVDGSYMSNNSTLTINSDTLKTLIIYPVQADVIGKINLNTPNLENLLYSDKSVTLPEGIANCKKLKSISFGAPSEKVPYPNLLLQSPEELELLITSPSNTQPNWDNTTSYVSYLSPLYGDSLQNINISYLSAVSSEELLKLVQNCPNLKNIIGLEITNAALCSPELLKICEENNCQTPFTEKSLEIHQKLHDIISQNLSRK